MPESQIAIFDGTAHEVSVQSVAITPPQTDEILVRVLGCTLCGSDLHTFCGRRSVAVPTILGHEIVGEIVEFGPEARREDYGGVPLAVGDRVTWAIVAACGGCFYCSHDLWPKCTRATKYGHERIAPQRELLGGLAEYALLVSGSAIFRLPQAVPLEVACPANCATATVAAALEAAGSLANATVAITGMGLLGLTACAMARSLGASTVIAVDVAEPRLARARDFGVTHTCPPSEFASVTAKVTHGRGVDAFVELSGSTEAIAQSWPQVRIGGTIVLVGAVFPGPAWSIAPEQIVRKQLTIRGIHNYSPRHLAHAVRFLSEWHTHYPFAKLVSAWFSLQEVQTAFTTAETGEHIRVGVRPA